MVANAAHAAQSLHLSKHPASVGSFLLPHLAIQSPSEALAAPATMMDSSLAPPT